MQYLEWLANNLIGIFCLCLCLAIIISSFFKGIALVIHGWPPDDDEDSKDAPKEP